jgi:hypothetical protein
VVVVPRNPRGLPLACYKYESNKGGSEIYPSRTRNIASTVVICKPHCYLESTLVSGQINIDWDGLQASHIKGFESADSSNYIKLL